MPPAKKRSTAKRSTAKPKPASDEPEGPQGAFATHQKIKEAVETDAPYRDIGAHMLELAEHVARMDGTYEEPPESEEEGEA